MKSKPTLNGGPRLTGDRNQCPTCHLYFNSSHAFEKHRTGSYGIDRRCLSASEMEAKGMVTNKAGFWIGNPRSQESILRPTVAA